MVRRRVFRHGWCALPLEISPFSLRPPQRERVTSGKSMAESERHSVPLSAAALPTDCGDWEPENVSDSGHCLEPGSDSLQEEGERKKIVISQLFILPAY